MEAGGAVIDQLREAVEASGKSMAQIAAEVKKPDGRGHYSGQWLGQALAPDGRKGRLRISLQDAEQVADIVGVQLRVIRPGDAVDAFRHALRENRLDPKVTRVIWRAFLEAKTDAVGLTQQPRSRARARGRPSGKLPAVSSSSSSIPRRAAGRGTR